MRMINFEYNYFNFSHVIINKLRINSFDLFTKSFLSNKDL